MELELGRRGRGVGVGRGARKGSVEEVGLRMDRMCMWQEEGECYQTRRFRSQGVAGEHRGPWRLVAVGDLRRGETGEVIQTRKGSESQARDCPVGSLDPGRSAV